MSKKIKQVGFIVINTVNLLFLSAFTAFAQPKIPQIDVLPGPDPSEVENVTGMGDYLILTFLPRIGLTVIMLCVGGGVLFLVIGAVQMMTAYGNEEKLGNAKKTMIFSIVGLFIGLLSLAIVQLLFNLGYYIDNPN